MSKSEFRIGEEQSNLEEDRQLNTGVIQPPKKQLRSPTTDRITLLFIFFFVVVMVLAFFRAGQPRSQQIAHEPTVEQPQTLTVDYLKSIQERKPTMGSLEHERTPKILWVLTLSEFQGLRMIESLVGKHLMHVGKKSGFDVRVVNSISAYDWLSPKMAQWVRQTKHKSKYISNVIDILRIALLVQHGGLSVKLSRYIFPDDLNWLYQLLEQPLEELIAGQQKLNVEYCNTQKDAEIVLFYDNGPGGERVYQDWVIYARKDSRLLRQTLEEMGELMIQGNWDLKYLINLQSKDNDLNVKFIQNFFIQLINFKQFYYFTGASFCQNYQVISIDKNSGEYLLKINIPDILKTDLFIDKDLFFKKYGRRHMIETDMGEMSVTFLQVLQREHMGTAHPKSIFRADLVQIEGNEWMVTPLPQARNVSYCLISLKPLPKDYQTLLNKSLNKINQQSYQQWRAVYFVTSLNQSYLDYSPKVRLVNASQYEGLNLQRAVITHCSSSNIGVILDYDQSLGAKRDLQRIDEVIRKRQIYGVYLSIKYKSILHKPKLAQGKIARKMMEPNKELLQQIVHHFRVFSFSAYRMIPTMSLHDNSGRYYDRELIFLTLLQMGWDGKRCNEDFTYFTKRIEHKLEIPRQRVILSNIYINVSTFREVDTSRQEYISKYSARPFCEAMKQYIQKKGRDLFNFFVLNNGSEFVGLQDRKNYPQRMEKKIHQIWVGGEMPNFKKYIMNKVRQNHPSYEYFLWTNANITRQNFPVSYDIIQRLLEHNKISRYNKMSMVANFMASEIIYNHGGIYMKTHYLVFGKNALDDWLTFDAVVPAHVFPYHRFQREDAIFAARKGFPGLKRIVDHRAISRRNQYSKFPPAETGPVFLSSIIEGDQELSANIFQPSYETAYPFYTWDDSSHKNLCEAVGNVKEQDIMFKNRQTYYKKCEKMYPWAIGIYFFQEGHSWG